MYVRVTAISNGYRDQNRVKGLQKYGSLLRWGWGRRRGVGGQEVSHLAFTTTGKVHQLRPDEACLSRWRGRGVIAGAEWIGTAGRGYDLCFRPYLYSATRFGHSC